MHLTAVKIKKKLLNSIFNNLLVADFYTIPLFICKVVNNSPSIHKKIMIKKFKTGINSILMLVEKHEFSVWFRTGSDPGIICTFLQPPSHYKKRDKKHALFLNSILQNLKLLSF